MLFSSCQQLYSLGYQYERFKNRKKILEFIDFNGMGIGASLITLLSNITHTTITNKKNTKQSHKEQRNFTWKVVLHQRWPQFYYSYTQKSQNTMEKVSFYRENQSTSQQIENYGKHVIQYEQSYHSMAYKVVIEILKPKSRLSATNFVLTEKYPCSTRDRQLFRFFSYVR